MKTESRHARLEGDGVVGVVRLARPDRRNALSRGLVTDALEALRVSRERGDRAVVIAAEGSVFCAGADAAELSAIPRDGGAPVFEGPTPLDLFEALDREDRPVVAAVDGRAFGGGVELTLPCDWVVASEAATFTLPELGLGVVPNTALALLPELVGRRRALDLIVGRRALDAGEALTVGLVDRVVPAGRAEAEAVDHARGLVAGLPPAALATSRRALHGDTDDRWRRIRELLGAISWAEAAEGMGAMMAGRAPDYEGFWAGSRVGSTTPGRGVGTT